MSQMPEFRVLITGGDGFVAPYAAKAILGAVEKAQILYTARRAMPPPSGCAFAEFDILDADTVARTVGKFRPTHILHLAGIASQNAAEDNPAAAWDVNVVATLRLANELRLQCPGATFLFVSSSQIYGSNISGLITENSPIGPKGAYASTKAAADLALGAMVSDDLRIVRFRPFNHTGPGQSAAYVFGGFAQQIASIEAGTQPPVVRVGNLEVKRDFMDVRDVAEAYAQSIALGQYLAVGSIFNLATGKPRTIGELLNFMLSLSNIKIEIYIDPNLQRSKEIEVLSGDSRAARIALNWNPTRQIETTLREMLDCTRTKLFKNSA